MANEGTLVTTSPMILCKKDKSTIGFGDLFVQYANEVLEYAHVEDRIRLSETAHAHISQTIARGWSFKFGNNLSELIPCIGMGSSVRVLATPQALATLAIYGIGEKINYGYGEIYILPEGM
jgi:hypothetical protein